MKNRIFAFSLVTKLLIFNWSDIFFLINFGQINYIQTLVPLSQNIGLLQCLGNYNQILLIRKRFRLIIFLSIIIAIIVHEMFLL